MTMAIDPASDARFPPRPRVALRVGISGHRTRPAPNFDAEAIHRACADVFDRLAPWLIEAGDEVYADDKPTLTLVTALAEGADQLATRAFEAGAGAHVNRRLEVVLPFAIDDYAATFSSRAAAQAMRDWSARAASTFTLADWSPPRGRKPSASAAHRRDRRYATLGDLVVRQADILLAVWDKEPSQGVGGTADVVALALAQGVPVIWIDPKTGQARLLRDAPRFGDLFSIVDQCAAPLDDQAVEALVRAVIAPLADDTPKEKRTTLDAFLTREQIPAKTWWGWYQSRLVAPAQRRLAKAKARLEAETGAAREPARIRPASSPWPIKVDHVAQGLRQTDWSGFPAEGEAYAPLRGDFSKAWAATDAISTKLGHVYRSTYLLIFCLGPLAVLIGLCGLLSEKFEGAFVFGELVILLAATALFRVGRDRGHHLRWLRGRELAEQFRAHWGLALAGLGGRRSLGHGATWNAWLFNAYAAPLGVPSLTATPAVMEAMARRVQEDVVRNQIAYHARNHDTLSSIHRRLEGWGVVMLGLAVAVSFAFLMFWLGTHPEAPWLAHGPTPSHGAPGKDDGHGMRKVVLHALTIVCATLPVIGAAFAGVRFQGDFERFADRSHETSEALKRIETALDAFIARPGGDAPLASAEPPMFETLHAIFSDLERVLLSDLEDWRFVYRARPSPEPG